MAQTKIIAHRGSKSTHPENTLPAFLHAVNIGADGIELDVQLSKDGHLVVIHDETVQRTTNGRGFVHQMTLEEIKQLDAGSWFSKTYRETRIPTLSEVLAILEEKSYRGLLNVELKTDRLDYPSIEEKVLMETQKNEWPFSIVYSSFNQKTLSRLTNLDPTIETAYLFKKPGEEKAYLSNGTPVSAWHPSVKWMKSASGKKHTVLPMRVWTVNNPYDLQKCFHLSVEAVITDFPEKALIMRKKFQEATE